jgi:hypothetical protein
VEESKWIQELRRMRVFIRLTHSLALIQLLLVSCSNLDGHPPLSFDDAYLNQQILLRVGSFLNTFKTSDPINLELKYNSYDEIVFPNNYNLKIFERTNGTWAEIVEKPITRLPAGDVVFSPTKEMPAVYVIYLSPDLKNINTNYQLRIYVFGNMKTNEGIQEVAAYTDIELHP